MLAFVIIFLTGVVVPSKVDLDPICSKLCKGRTSGGKMQEFCKHNNFTLNGHCCVNDIFTGYSSVVGLDLHSCSLTESLVKNSIINLHNLEYIMLEDNPIMNITSSDLINCTTLEYLSLPSGLSCPGGPEAWRQELVDASLTECWGQLDPCVARNLTCPENSHCVHKTFDGTQCLCDEGFHGYKCMNQGTFPLVPFFVGLIVPTVILSILLWFTQRRYVIANKKK